MQTLLDRRWDFLSANRFPLAEPRAMSFSNRFGNWVLTVATALLFFQPIRDSQSGMWVFRRPALERMRLTSDGMAFSEEIKLEALCAACASARLTSLRGADRGGQTAEVA